jgi:hypothetical protein
MRQGARLIERAPVGGKPRERLAQIPEGHEAVGKPLDELEPQDRAGPCRYRSSLPRQTSRPATVCHR